MYRPRLVVGALGAGLALLAACGGSKDGDSLFAGGDASIADDGAAGSGGGEGDASPDAAADAPPEDVSAEAAPDVEVGDAPDAPADAPPEAAPDATDDAAGDAGTACGSLPSCDDGILCTSDVCQNGTCLHLPGGPGATACAATAYCDPSSGCTARPVCATDQDCASAFAGDACKQSPRCDAATSTCTFKWRDVDGDGHASIACHGDDCDDVNHDVHPGAAEVCNGKDDSCGGGTPDVGATCPALHACSGGTCACLPANSCGASCVDLATDEASCGSCGHACPGGASCLGAQCVCQGGLFLCGSACVNLQTDGTHCGNCAIACGTGKTCVAGQCQAPSCTAPQTECDGDPTTFCETNTSTDVANCGTCAHSCARGDGASDGTCAGGACGMTCRGEHYDVDGQLSDGCERTETGTPGHDWTAATAIGSQGCSDGTTGWFQGDIFSDARVHANPPIPFFDAATGSAPDWWSIIGSGGTLCANNYGITITTSGGGTTGCYVLAFRNGGTLVDSVTVNGSQTATISTGATGIYADGSTLYFEVYKSCSSAVREAVHYSVSFHL